MPNLPFVGDGTSVWKVSLVEYGDIKTSLGYAITGIRLTKCKNAQRINMNG